MDYVWGVVDMIPDTDFPDIRNRCVIHSNYGSCMVIPREGDVVRLYIQLDARDLVDGSGRRSDGNKMGPHVLLEVCANASYLNRLLKYDLWIQAARQIVSPYTIKSPATFDWWTIYVGKQRTLRAPWLEILNLSFFLVGQRVAASFSVDNRVFIVGDACHTHSPKAGNSPSVEPSIYTNLQNCQVKE